MMDLNQVINDLREKLAKAESERDAFAAQVDILKDWRRLAMQFDAQRMQAMSYLKQVTTTKFSYDEVSAFVAAAPQCGNKLLAAHDAEVAAKAVDDAISACSESAFVVIDSHTNHFERIDICTSNDLSQYATQLRAKAKP